MSEIFIPKPQANTVLNKRIARANRNNLEEDNQLPSLKRECIEERCDLTEAAEIIDNSNKLDTFYKYYKLCSNKALQNLNLNNTRRRKNLRAKPSRREKSFIKGDYGLCGSL